jgi:hypothetical protein
MVARSKTLSRFHTLNGLKDSMGDLGSCFVLCECVRIIERVIYHVLAWVNMHMEFGVFGADQAAGKFSCGSHTDSCIFRHGFGCRGPL